MTNQACRGVPVAATGKVGMTSVSGGYKTAQRILFRTIGLMLYSTEVSLVSVFRRRTVFKLLTRFKFTDAIEKSVYGEKRPLNGKFSKFRYEKIHADTDSCISAKYRANLESGSDQTGAWYSSQKRLV